MKKQFKKIILLVFVILFITLTPFNTYINSKNIAYAADTLIDGLSMKVTATILASMGVLPFVNNEIGLQEFYDGLTEFSENVKLITNLPQQIFQIASTAIITSTKMKINSVKNIVKEYWDSITKEMIIKENELVDPILDNVIASTYYYNQTSIGNIMTATNSNPLINDKTDYLRSKTIDKGYTLYLSSSMWRNNITIYATIMLGTTIVHQIALSHRKEWDWYTSDQIILNSRIDFNNDRISIVSRVIDMATNELYINTKSEPFTLIALNDMPLEQIITIEDSLPIAKPVPLTLTFPWDLDINTEDVLGLDIDGLLEVINNLQLEEYLDRLLDLPKSIVDSMNPAEILVEDGVITGVNETTWDDVLAEGKEHTTILQRIADGIDSIATKVDEFFNPENTPPGSEDDNGTDWGNFKNFFDIFWIFYYLIILAIIILLKFFGVIMSMLVIPANTALFDQYPTMLSGLNYIKNIKVGGFNVTIQTIFEYMFTVFFFLYIVTTLQKLYHSFMGIERQVARENKDIKIDSNDLNKHNTEYSSFNKDIKIDSNDINKHYTEYSSFNKDIYNKEIYGNDKSVDNIKFTGWGDEK